MQPIVDLRSDTVTRPTAAMRAAMASAEVGDDVFRDDPTVLALERRVAELLGKEAALFVPSGTMANQIALRVHASPGTEVIAHAGAHLYNYEGGGAAALGGIQVRPLESDDGTLPLMAVQRAWHDDSDPHLAPTALIAFEDTHNACGGVVIPRENVHDVAAFARSRNTPLHLDGARLWNAAVASGQSVAELAAPFDTVSVCFSKGLGAPVGSALVGSQAHIRRALRLRKQLGGGLRQAGILAAAANYALDHHRERLSDDHRRARQLADAIANTPGLTCDVRRVQSNLVYFGTAPGHPMGALDDAGRPAVVGLLRERGVWVTGSAVRLRAVLHLDVDDAALDRVLTALSSLAR
jgi:threonine aldolase